MKRQISLFAALILLMLWIVPTEVSATEANACGDNLTWNLSGGTLTISGTGAMYDYTGYGSSGTAPWATKISWITSVVVEEGVTYIGTNAFPQYHRITSVTLPSTLETIGERAFWNCNGLKSLTLPEGLKKINNYAFEGCYSLETVTIPSTLEYLGSAVFDSTPWIEGLTEEGMHYAGKVAFKFVGTPGETVEIADGTTQLVASLFGGCTGLKQIDLPDSLRSIGWGTFYACSGLNEIELPNSLTSIDAYAFYGCSSLEEISIPNGVTSIGEYTFKGCSALEEVNLGNGMTSIGSHAFYECAAIKGLSLGGNVTSIGESAFYGCSGITELTIPNNGTVIGDYAFYNCEGLKKLTIPEYLEADVWSFSGTTFVEKLYFMPGTQTLSYDSLPVLSAMYMVIPESVTQIQSGAVSRVFNTSNAGEIYILGNPEIAEDAFVNQKNGYTFDVTADVYTFTQWNEADKQNYGGTLTWKEGSTNVGVLDDAPYWYDLNESIDAKWFTYGCADSSGNVISHGTVDASAISAYDNSTTGLKTVTVTVGAKQCEYTYHVIDCSKIGPDTFNASTAASVVYTGEKLTPAVTVCFQDVVLEEGRDYTLEYSNNLDAGSAAKVTVTGKGMFAGQTATCGFAITKRDMADATISVSTYGLNYTGTAKCPSVNAVYNDITLREGSDYVLSYANNVAQGDATVTVMGIGNFSGQQTLTFTITEPVDSDYIERGFGSGTIYVRDQTIRINLGEKLLSGYTLYKNGVAVSHSSIPSSAYSISQYVYINMSSYGVGTYELVVVCQGYTMTSRLVNGSYRYVYQPSGSASSASYTVYRQADRTEMTDTLPTAITAQPGQWLNVRQVYLPVTAEPAGANLFPQSWESSNTEVATVENGLVTLHKAGKATITLTVGELTATWEIETEALNLNNATITGFDADTQSFHVVHSGEVLIQDVDYTVATRTVGGSTAYVLSGCNLFSGKLIYCPDTAAEGWIAVGSDWYYLVNGTAHTGWRNIGGDYYYFGRTGVMATGWVQDNGTWYYMKPSGVMHTGWRNIGGTYYYFDASGAMATGWCTIGGDYYNFDANGIMQTGWLSDGGSWYYLKSSGVMAKGWLQIGGVWYYFHSSGEMATGTVNIGGTDYHFTSSGEWIN